VPIVTEYDGLIKISRNPYYETRLGSAYLGNSLTLMGELPDESVDLICTSPPFALVSTYWDLNKFQAQTKPKLAL
jgi:site-specific DNA-methyltransferase (cytosine-N4-specific)